MSVFDDKRKKHKWFGSMIHLHLIGMIMNVSRNGMSFYHYVLLCIYIIYICRRVINYFPTQSYTSRRTCTHTRVRIYAYCSFMSIPGLMPALFHHIIMIFTIDFGADASNEMYNEQMPRIEIENLFDRNGLWCLDLDIIQE